MHKLEDTNIPDHDPTAAERKQDHIELAFASQVKVHELDGRFYYEPLLAAHPSSSAWPPFPFLGKTMRAPIWVSSMTGGTEKAKTINENLARACGEFGLGMGLGSCRPLLYSDERLPDFDVRHLMGDDAPLFANLGIAQLEQLHALNDWQRLRDMLGKLQADGLIIHVNPLQEWLQPEGDRFQKAPLTTIKRVLDHLPGIAVIVKEVGQGMGPQSLKALLQLPLAAIDFAASGGTNFAKLELLRSDKQQLDRFAVLSTVGHTAHQMTLMLNAAVEELGDTRLCNAVIISGGVQHFLDGYYLTELAQLPAIYGQASGFLAHAQGNYAHLQQYVSDQISGLAIARAYLHIRK